MVSSENKDPWDTLGHLDRQEPGQTGERPRREYAHHCPPVATEARIPLLQGWEIQLLSYLTRGPLPEPKLVDRDVFMSQSKEVNACFLSLTEKSPRHPLMRASCLCVHFNTHSVLVTGLKARDKTTAVTPRGQDSKWLSRAKRWSPQDFLHRERAKSAVKS